MRFDIIYNSDVCFYIPKKEVFDMCCFLNRRCAQNDNCCLTISIGCNNRQCHAPFGANGYANWQMPYNCGFANNQTAFGNGFVPYNAQYGGQNAGTWQNNNVFANCCRHTRFFANNFAFDRPVSASFVHSPDYHNVARLNVGFDSVV